MHRRARACAASLIGCLIFLAGSVVPLLENQGEGIPKQEAANKEFFGRSRVLPLHLELTPENYQAMQPPVPAGVPGGPPPATRPKKVSGRESEKNLFGVEFPWSRGTLTADGRTFKGVDVRYSGNASYLASAWGLKRSFLVELASGESAGIHGLRALQLQAGALDPSKAREALAFALFREAGVPAPRTALAEVTLTVPGKHEKAYLGLYTLVEPVDRAFLKNRFQDDRGLLLRPQGLRGLDYLGDDWAKYRGPYRPLTEPTPDQARRLIEFVRLVQQADDEKFRKEISSYLDVDRFLRFMAVQALVANADGFFTLGYNYSLYLDPRTNRFVFIPGDQELSFANFAMLGTADQLMEMSLTRPYGGENRLADRLLAIKEFREAQQVELKYLATTIFQKDRLFAELTAIEALTKGILERETRARTERQEPPAGFGPPGAPGPPNLHTFIERRTASVADQIAGKKDGYRPQFNFGPPPRTAPAKPLDDASIGEVVKAPEGFKVNLFVAPPRVGYPVALSVAPVGDVYVAVDEQGSLGRTPGGGRIVRCVDENGDGKADRVTVFAKMEHPRGVIAQDGKVWVLHPPLLSVFQDTNGDGVSDSQEILVSGLTTSQIDERGGDHTTNGIRMGIDGWIYIAVGDYGFHGAKGKDGIKLSQRGGGILRVRPDGTELEVVAIGLRNPFAIAIDPYLNLFTRDNSNDGAGWDVRVSHLIQGADYGYTQRFTNYPDEVMPPLGVFGQGGGTGALSLHDERWPAAYRNVLLTGDWGRSEVYRHELKPAGATFLSNQSVFLSIPRPTGMDLGGDGRLYVASWRGGDASVYVGPEVGFIATVTPPDWSPSTHSRLSTLTIPELVEALCSPNAVQSFQSQREILKRGASPKSSEALQALASDTHRPLPGRVAAIFAIAQLDGARSRPALEKLAKDASVSEFAIRALADRKPQLAGIKPDMFVSALADPSPRVRAQAVIALGRLANPDVAGWLVPLTSRPEGSKLPTTRPVHAQPDPDRVVPHLATRSLVSLQAADACLEAIDGPHREGALRALRSMHEVKSVNGIIKKLGTARAPELRRELLATLVRLYHRESSYDGSWWGIRPDTSGPYYAPQTWEGSERIAAVLKAAILDRDAETSSFLRKEMARQGVSLKGLPATPETERPREEEIRVQIAQVDPKNLNQIGNMSFESASSQALRASGDVVRGKAIFKERSCRACHIDADGQTPKGPHLVDIGKRSTPAELVESILKPSAKIAQGYESYGFALTDGRVFTGFVVTEGPVVIQIREGTGAVHDLKRSEIEERQRRAPSAMPEGIAASLTPAQLADLIAYLRSLDSARVASPER